MLSLALMMAKISAVSTTPEPNIEVPLTSMNDGIDRLKLSFPGRRKYSCTLSQNKRRKLLRGNSSLVNIKKYRKYRK